MRFIIGVLFIWAGFILSISFFESWVKFRAAGVTLPVALSIGKLIFTVLNRIEWVFAGILVISFLLSKGPAAAPWLLYFLIALVVVLLIQTFWLLPELNTRAVSRINGLKVAPSHFHHYFVLAELIKLTCLFVAGSKLLKTI